MKRLWLVLALTSAGQELPPAAAGPEEARALLADVRAWRASAELPAAADVEAVRAIAETLCAGSDAPRDALLQELVRELGELGHRLGRAGRRGEAQDLVRWSAEHGEPATRAWALDWLGQEAWVHGQLEEAAGWILGAAEVDARRGAREEHTRHLADVARIRLTQGRFDEALEAAVQAEEVARACGAGSALRAAAEIRGGILLELGRHREALETCLAHAVGEDSAPDEPGARLEILAANVLADVGRLETAAAHARRAHEIALDPRVARVAPLLHLEAKLSLGLLLGDLGRSAEALQLLDDAAAEFERLGDVRGAGWAAKNRGFVLVAAGRRAESVPAFERAWRVGAELGVPFLEGFGALGVAEALVLDEAADGDGESRRVAEALEAAERVAQSLHERTLPWRCAALRARLWLARGEPGRALEEARRAVELVERWRRRLGASGLVEHALRQRADPYRDAAFAAASLGRLEEALGFAGLLHARVLDELRARRSGPLPAPATPAIAALRERAARLALAEPSDPRALERAEDELDAALLAHEMAAGRWLRPRYDRLALETLQQALRRQELDLALVYLVGPRETLVLRIDAAGPAAVTGRFLACGREQLAGWVRALREPVARLEAGQLDLTHLGFDVGAARSLHEALVRPLALGGTTRIALVADDVLTAIPFELFVTGGEPRAVDLERPFAHLTELAYLGDERSFVVHGSLASVLSPPEPRAGETVILTAPRDAGPARAAEEAQRIARALGGARVVPDVHATDVARLAVGAGRVHFAAHGRFDPERPAHGHLVLGGEGPDASATLESWQVAELDLAGAQVVLSACHSARGAYLAGAGLAGLLRGFFLAGAREVIASPWAVDDRVTARFMELFYGELARGRSAPDALRGARARLRTETDPRGFALAHPVFWAAWSVYR